MNDHQTKIIHHTCFVDVPINDMSHSTIHPKVKALGEHEWALVSTILIVDKVRFFFQKVELIFPPDPLANK